MSRLLKKSIKSRGIIKVNKMVKKIADKSDRVLLYKFLLQLMQTQRSYQSIHHLHKHEQLRAFQVFRYGHNKFYNQDIILTLGLGPAFPFLWLLATLLMLWRTWPTCFLPKLYQFLLKGPVSILWPYLFPV